MIRARVRVCVIIMTLVYSHNPFNVCCNYDVDSNHCQLSTDIYIKEQHKYNYLIRQCVLPGQLWSLQICLSSSLPGHGAPPYFGSSHTRVRSCHPPPHVTLHCSHSVQFPQTPSTERNACYLVQDPGPNYHVASGSVCIVKPMTFTRHLIL